ncbi:MAG: hypothetical protein HDR22_11055 [Lachnospiraceae bacterium]|nr:hypothetical protein [Lachnospiraceae bacterium]
MIKILFICHGTTADSRDLSALVGQSAASRTVGYYGFTTIEETKKRACIPSPFPVFFRTSVAVP